MDSVSNSGLEMDFQKLISCIHWHEDSNDSQVIVETLNTITDICNNEACGRDAFREAGGLDFLVEFMFTTNNTLFLEHSLKALACVIDENVHNQTYMTKKAVFEVIQTILKNTTFPIIIRKNAVVLVSSILYQNSTAQSLINEVGLLQDLLQAYEQGAQRLLAGNSYSSTSDDPLNELWISSNSALCFAVNNPQNEKNQDICSRIFSISLRILEVATKCDIISSVSAFLSLCISNNKNCQDKFSEFDGLQVTKRLFQKYYDLVLADAKDCNNVLRKGTLQVVGNIIGIISAAASEHEQNSVIFGKLGVLSLMVELLFLKILDVNLKTKIVLSLGHTIDACSSNKVYVLNKENFDTLLKECLHIGNPELSSACKYLLQICLLQDETSADGENNGVRVDCLVERYDKDPKPGFVNSSDLKKVSTTTEERCSVKRPSSCASISKSKAVCNQKYALEFCNDIESFNTSLAKKARTDTFDKENKPIDFDFHSFFNYITKKSRSAENSGHSNNILASQKDTDSIKQNLNCTIKKRPSKTQKMASNESLAKNITEFQESDSSPDSSDSPYYPLEALLDKSKPDNPQQKDQISKDISQNITKNERQCEKLLFSNPKDKNNHLLSNKSSNKSKRPILKDSTNLDELGLLSKKFKLNPVFERHRKGLSRLSSSSLQLPNRRSNNTSDSPCSPSKRHGAEFSSSSQIFQAKKLDDEESCYSSKTSDFIFSGCKRTMQADKTKKRIRLHSSTPNESPSEVNESYLNNFVEVIVFPAEKCDQHNLISSFENLQVVPLDEAQQHYS